MLDANDSTEPIRTIDIAWLGGLLEGEGCFVAYKTAVEIRLAMTDMDTVDRAARILRSKSTGPHMRNGPSDKPHWKPKYFTWVSGAKAAGWMMILFPFLGMRRQAKVIEILGKWKRLGPRNSAKTHCPQGHPYSQENTYCDPRGIRHCIQCKNEKRRGKYQAWTPEQRLAHLEKRRQNYQETKLPPKGQLELWQMILFSTSLLAVLSNYISGSI